MMNASQKWSTDPSLPLSFQPQEEWPNSKCCLEKNSLMTAQKQDKTYSKIIRCKLSNYVPTKRTIP